MTTPGYNRGYQASMQLFTRVYDNVPYFTEIFDEDTFYIAAFLFVAASFLMAFILSRYIKLQESDW
jgi:hypothetical protein